MSQNIIVTTQNLNDFRRWISQNPTTKHIQDTFYFNVPLAAVLDGMPELNENQQKIIATIIAKSATHKDIETMLDLSTKYPHILGYTYMISGNGNGAAFWDIINTLKKRKFEQNIPAIYALLHYGNVEGTDVGYGEISHTSPEKSKMLNEMFAPKQQHKMGDPRESFERNTKDLFKNLDRLQLLNFDGASPEMREYINRGIITDNYKRRNVQQILDIVNRIDEKFFTPEIIRDLIPYVGQKPNTVDTSNAKTQAEKKRISCQSITQKY